MYKCRHEKIISGLQNVRDIVGDVVAGGQILPALGRLCICKSETEMQMKRKKKAGQLLCH